MRNTVVQTLVDRHIRGTEKESLVQNVQSLLCEITVATMRGIHCGCRKAYISTRVLKHVYDKRPAEEFDFLIENLFVIIRYPDRIFRNKNQKRGDYIFVKKIRNGTYCCSVQEIKQERAEPLLEIATFFRVNKENYLSSYELLWEWKGGDLHRNAFDSSLR